MDTEQELTKIKETLAAMQKEIRILKEVAPVELKYYTTKQIAAELGISYCKAYEIMGRDDFPSAKYGGMSRVEINAFNEWKRQQELKTGKSIFATIYADYENYEKQHGWKSGRKKQKG